MVIAVLARLVRTSAAPYQTGHTTVRLPAAFLLYSTSFSTMGGASGRSLNATPDAVTALGRRSSSRLAQRVAHTGTQLSSPASESVAVAAAELAELSTAVTPTGTPAATKKRARRKRSVQVQKATSSLEKTAVDKFADKAFLYWTHETMELGLKHIQEHDPKMRPLIEKHGAPARLMPKPDGNMFGSLAKSVIFQQLATGAAQAIYKRFLLACKCEEEAVTAPLVLATPMEDLRACGLSARKASYVVDLAEHFSSGALSDAAIKSMDEETLEVELTKVKGIGRWTVDMFAMFHLGRPDVLPVGDLGVRRGFQIVFGLKDLATPVEMEALSEPWRPYRSLGSCMMWNIEAPSRSPKKRKAAGRAASKVMG